MSIKTFAFFALLVVSSAGLNAQDSKFSKKDGAYKNVDEFQSDDPAFLEIVANEKRRRYAQPSYVTESGEEVKIAEKLWGYSIDDTLFLHVREIPEWISFGFWQMDMRYPLSSHEYQPTFVLDLRTGKIHNAPTRRRMLKFLEPYPEAYKMMEANTSLFTFKPVLKWWFYVSLAEANAVIRLGREKE